MRTADCRSFLPHVGIHNKNEASASSKDMIYDDTQSTTSQPQLAGRPSKASEEISNLHKQRKERPAVNSNSKQGAQVPNKYRRRPEWADANQHPLQLGGMTPHPNEIQYQAKDHPDEIQYQAKVGHPDEFQY